MWTEFDPGSFSHKVSCTSLFTDKFGIITEVFRAIGKLDAVSLYITWPSNCTWSLQSRNFRNTTRKQTQNDTECSEHNDAWEQVQINFSWKSTVLFIRNDWQCKAAQASCSGFSPKASELHSAIMRMESDLGSNYHTEQCTARFTDNFGITTHLIYSI